LKSTEKTKDRRIKDLEDRLDRLDKDKEIDRDVAFKWELLSRAIKGTRHSSIQLT
jgi:hypothetical protein